MKLVSIKSTQQVDGLNKAENSVMHSVVRRTLCGGVCAGCSVQCGWQGSRNAADVKGSRSHLVEHTNFVSSLSTIVGVVVAGAGMVMHRLTHVAHPRLAHGALSRSQGARGGRHP